jgi:radical SAM protein with 4Fe4S-binding SPASM domain
MGDCACDVRIDQLDPSARLAHFFLELTPDCNNACPGCGSAHAHQTRKPALSTRTWRMIVDRLPRSDLQLRLSGGEPTLHPEFAEIIDSVEDKGIPFTVFTNARWQDPEATIALLRDKQHLQGILVSIHGARAASHEAFTAVRGSFQEAVENARMAAEAGIRVVTSTVITRQNYGEMKQILALTWAIGAERATFSRFIGPSLSGIEANEEELRIAVTAIEDLMDHTQPPHGKEEPIRYGAPIPHCFVPNRSNGCMAGFVHATIDPWGNLRPCPHVPTIAGNVLRQDLDEIWSSPTMRAWRGKLLAQCDGCLLVDTCRSGCQAQASWRNCFQDPLITREMATNPGYLSRPIAAVT